MNLPPSYANWFESLGLEDYQGGQETMSLIFNELEQLNHESSTNFTPQKIVDDSSMLNFVRPQEKATHDVSCAKTKAMVSRRKNKHKIVKAVQQAGRDRVECDKWNWRKYGEKIIKGSPHPRSYYKCSHTGGCLARKQVEQSNNDPRLFLITYMGEHAHPYPTRRHSQAGLSARRIHNSYASPEVVNTTNESQNMSLVRRTIPSEPSIKHEQVLDLQDDSESCVGENGVCIRNNEVCEDDDFFAGLDYLETLKYGFL